MQDDKIQLVHHFYEELEDDNGGWRKLLKEYDRFTVSERNALLNKPSGFSKDEVYAVTAEYNNIIVGGHVLFTTRVKLYDDTIIAQTGTYLYSKEEFQKKNVGSFVFFDSMRVLKSQNGIYFGISQRALGLYRALKYRL